MDKVELLVTAARGGAAIAFPNYAQLPQVFSNFSTVSRAVESLNLPDSKHVHAVICMRAPAGPV